MSDKKTKILYLIGGTMGVGKTPVCRRLKIDLPKCVFWLGTGAGMQTHFR